MRQHFARDVGIDVVAKRFNQLVVWLVRPEINRKTTIGSITSRYWGGRYGPRSRFAISQILAFSSSCV